MRQKLDKFGRGDTYAQVWVCVHDEQRTRSEAGRIVCVVRQFLSLFVYVALSLDDIFRQSFVIHTQTTI